MHYGNWQDGPGSGSGVWMVLMVVMMIAFWGGLAAVLVVVLRRPHHLPPAPPAAPTGAGLPATALHSPQEILAERLARGEIELDDYQQRLDVLNRTGT